MWGGKVCLLYRQEANNTMCVCGFLWFLRQAWKTSNPSPPEAHFTEFSSVLLSYTLLEPPKWVYLPKLFWKAGYLLTLVRFVSTDSSAQSVPSARQASPRPTLSCERKIKFTTSSVSGASPVAESSYPATSLRCARTVCFARKTTKSSRKRRLVPGRRKWRKPDSHSAPLPSRGVSCL